MAELDDVIDLLLADHRAIRNLVDQLQTTNDPSQARHAYLELVERFSSHEAAEEQVLFPVLRALGPMGEGEAAARTGEHREVDALLDRMRLLSPISYAFVKRAAVMASDVRAHLDAEETEVFPRLRAVLSHGELVALASRVTAVESRAPAYHVS